MKNKLTRLWVCSVCIVLSLGSYSNCFAQPQANFSASPVSGCSPIVVSFTDQSTGNPTQWKWDLGNGSISFLQNPSTTYFTPGTYNVKLIVSNPSGADSIIKNQYITVYANPTVNFTSTDTVGCIPHFAQFNSNCTPGSGSITNYNWDFGDGVGSTLPNPSHVYSSSGNFTVTLRVTNNHGCVTTFSKTNYIHVGGLVNADFTNTNAGICSPTATINFTNISTGPAALSYSWNFGDGATSILTNPTHTYSNTGTYTVSLIAVSPQGCADTIVKTNLISIGTINSQFSGPDSVCTSTDFTLVNTTTPAPVSVLWSFGDGTTSTQMSPSKNYTSAGNYTIKLINNFGACADSISKSIFVRSKPVAAFTSNQTAFCSAPFTVNFINQSTGGNSCQWDFGDGSFSTSTNPTHTYTSYGNFTVTLITTNANGCSDTLVKPQYINLTKPEATINGFPQTGCIPLTVNPTATVVSIQPVTNYFWDFGDGSTSTAANPVHTYTNAGSYSVKLIITTASGCADTTTITDAVKVGNKPTAAFTVNPADVCAYYDVYFTDNSSGNVDQWFWIFGDGGTSTIQNPHHQYTDTGYISVTLVVGSNTCKDTVTIINAVHIKPPIAAFAIANSCADKYHKDFVDHSIGATSWQWDFGDGTSSTLQNPSHNYSTPGNYAVILRVTNGSCEHLKTDTVKVMNEQGVLTADHDHQCKNSNIHFVVTGVNATNIANWQWDFGDGTSSSSVSSAVHAYTNSGNYTVSVIITDLLGCKDSLSIPVVVFGPTALFTSSVQSACVGNSSVLFTDASTSDGNHPIVQWIWNYADGTVDSISNAPFIHTYMLGGTYAVSLQVKDGYGCTNQYSLPTSIVIYQPKANFSSPDSLSCVNKPIHFIDASTGDNLTYLWQFGDGTSGTVSNPVHNYLNAGNYTVKLKVTDQNGCKDSLIKNNYISISTPHASFAVSDSISSCPPLLVNFTNNSTGYNSFIWDFGDGNNSTMLNPSHYYTSPGIYFARLSVTAPGGCTDTLIKRIQVNGPQGNFFYSPQTGCKPTTVSFTATSQNNISFIWDFSDGNILSTNDSAVTHVYTTIGDFIPKMILQDASGCTVPISGTENIHVMGVNVNFQTDVQQFCDSGTVHFQNNSISNDPITGYIWTFGDGATSNNQQPVHNYTSPGLYNVQLKITTQSGCTDSLTLADTIKVYTSPAVTVINDTAACAPAVMNFAGQILTGNQLQWQWNFGNGQTSNFQNTATQYNAAGTYNVLCKATDDHGCKDSVVKAINIYPIPNTTANADAMICKGSSIQLSATGANNYSWAPAVALSCISCANPTANPSDTISYVVTGFNAFGCSKTDSVLIKVKQPFLLTVSPGDSICVGETTHLSASGADQYNWFPTTGLNHPNSSATSANPNSTTIYRVIARDNDNCFTDTATVTIVVSPLPTVNAGNDMTISSGTPGQLNATGSTDVTNWSWTPQYYLSCYSCPTPKAEPKQTTTYTITAKNAAGCTTKDEVTVFVTCNKGNLYIPNTFSPNGDGMNDRFYPRGTGIGIIRSFRVFNRWGELVYEKVNFNANDAGTGWDGTYKGHKLSPDVFIYTCEVVCENNQVMLYKGDVTLIQ